MLDHLRIDIRPSDLLLRKDDDLTIDEVLLGDGLEVRGEDLVVAVQQQFAVAAQTRTYFKLALGSSPPILRTKVPSS